jgi:tRNA 2-thiouridine synthesizing protein E
MTFDEEGHLVDPADWNESVAAALARKEGIAVTEAHWTVRRFMRKYYGEHHIAPDARHVMRHLAGYRGPGKADRNDLFRLFPYGHVKQACKIAGMRRPRTWSTG